MLGVVSMKGLTMVRSISLCTGITCQIQTAPEIQCAIELVFQTLQSLRLKTLVHLKIALLISVSEKAQ